MDRGYQNSLKMILSAAGSREIIFWGIDELSKYVYLDLYDMGHDIKYFVADQLNERCILYGKEVKPWIELFYEDKETIFIVAFVFSGHGDIYDKLQSMGFEFEQDFLLYGFGGYMQNFDVVDSVLGYNRFYGDLLGFQILGKLTDDAYKIMVLGGSTVDPTMGNHTSWTKFLYDKLKEFRSNVVIINGGLAGYSVYQEFNKFVRDGLAFEPNLLITYDGINDAGCLATDKDYPNLTPYARKVFDYIEQKGDFAPDTLQMRSVKKIVHGISKRNAVDVVRWKYTIRQIHAIANEFGIQHLGFLQPMLTEGAAIIEASHQKLIQASLKALPVYSQWIESFENFRQQAVQFCEEKEYMFDLTKCLDGKVGVYYDICHCTDVGNKIIADEIYHIIVKREENLKC